MNTNYYRREKMRIESKLDILLSRIETLRGLTPDEDRLYCTELSKLYSQADKYASEYEAVKYALSPRVIPK